MTRSVLVLLMLIMAVGRMSMSAETPPSKSLLVWDHDARIAYDTATASESPHWGRGALLAIEDLSGSPRIRSFDKSGGELSSVEFSLPGAREISVSDYSGGVDGRLVLSGAATDKDGRHSGFIAVISRGGGIAQITRTNPYVPFRSVFATDGSVWTVGTEMVEGLEPPTARDKDVIHQFDSSGKQLASFITRSTIESRDSIVYGYLAAARDRVVWYAGGMETMPAEYVEISRDGSVRRYPGVLMMRGERVTGLAAMDDAETFVTTHDSDVNRSRLHVFDRIRGTWTPIELPINLQAYHWVSLYGGEGDTLVFKGPDRFVLHFYRLRR